MCMCLGYAYVECAFNTDETLPHHLVSMCMCMCLGYAYVECAFNTDETLPHHLVNMPLAMAALSLSLTLSSHPYRHPNTGEHTAGWGRLRPGDYASGPAIRLWSHQVRTAVH